MIVLRTPKGWTGPKEVDGNAGRGHLPLAPGAARRTSPTNPEHLAPARGVAAQLPARGAVRRATGALARRAGGAGARRASAAWAPTRTPTAGCCCATSSCRTSATTRSTCPRPAQTSSEATRVLGDLPARRDALNELAPNFRLFGPDETASNRLDAVFEVDRPRLDRRDRCPATTTSSPDGRVMEVLSEHLCQGWLEGYLLTGRHGLFNCYEAFIHIVDSMFNQHAKWLKVTPRHPVAAADRLAQLPAQLARLAPGPQRLLPPGPRLHRPRREQEGRDHPRLPAAGRQLPALGGRPLPAQPRLRQRDRRGQAAGARLPRDGRGRSRTARAGSASGTGRATTTATSPTSCWPAPATSRRSRRSPAAALLREHLPELRVRVVNVVDLMRLQPDTEHPHGLPDARVRRAVHRPTGRSSSPTTAIRG